MTNVPIGNNYIAQSVQGLFTSYIGRVIWQHQLIGIVLAHAALLTALSLSEEEGGHLGQNRAAGCQ